MLIVEMQTHVVRRVDAVPLVVELELLRRSVVSARRPETVLGPTIVRKEKRPEILTLTARNRMRSHHRVRARTMIVSNWHPTTETRVVQRHSRFAR